MALDPIQHLLAKVPEFRGIYEHEASKWDDEPIPRTVICSDILAESVLKWIDSLRSDDAVAHAFEYIEDLASDDEVGNQELALYFLEFFPAPRSLYFRALQYAGPCSKEMLATLRQQVDKHRIED